MFKRYATKMGNFSIALFFMFLSSGAFTNNALAASTDEYPPSQDSILNGTYEWSRRDLIIANINDKQYSFIDSDPYDSTFQYKIDSRQSICDGKISLSDNSSSASAKIDIDFGPTCNQTSPNAIEKTMGKPENANIWFVWFNQDSIVQVSDGGKADRQYIRESEGSSVFAQKGVDACADKLIVRSGPPPYVNIFRFDKEDGSDPQDLISSGDLNLLKPAGCKLYSTFIIGKVRDKVYNFGLGNTQNASIPPSEKPLDSGSGTTDESPSCEGSIDNGFGWIICPALGLIDNFIDGAEAVIASKLAVDTNTFDGSIETGNDLRETWTVMARIASGLLSIIALIMIISTALGFDFVSAYTLKKVLPRIVIGAIGIWLSWPFAVAYISFMNDLGRGLASLMYAAFPDNISTLGLRDIIGVAAENSDVGTDLAAGAIFTGLAAVSIGSIGIFGLLAAALSVAAAILIGIFVLAIREMLIIVFVVFAPIAVAAWIMPNTSKIWKFWSSNFNKLLLMFPMIMGLFAAAKIMAYVSAQAANENPGMLEVLFPIIIFVSPFFFLPKLFKSAGGVLTGITSMASKAGDRATGGVQKTFKGYADASQARKKKEGDQRLYSRAASGSGLANFQLRARAGQNILGRSFSPSKSRREARNSQMDASRAIMQEAFEKQQIEEAETALRRGAVSDSTGAVDYNNAQRLLDLVQDTNSTDAQKRAALNRLTQLRATPQLEEARTHFNGGGVWASHQDSNYSAMRDFAPHLVGRDFSGASAEAASGWTLETWQRAIPEGPLTEQQTSLAQDVVYDQRLRASLSAEVIRHLESRVPRPSGGGTPNPPASPGGSGGTINIPHGGPSSGGGTPNPPASPGGSGGTINLPPNSSTGGGSFS